MADVFYSKDAIQLLAGKKIYFIGDSNVRALYKDVICLINHNRLLTHKQLKAKAEREFLGDHLLRGSPLTKGREYREDRRFKRNGLHVEFHFVTKCLNEDIKCMMDDFRSKRISAPDIIVMNSTQWDVNRWGPDGVEIFKDNMHRLMQLFKSSLPASTLVIWVTAPPLSVEIRGGYMIKQLEFARFTMRFHVMEANLYAKELVSQYGFNILDFHFHLQWQVHWRSPDGIHWSSKSMRFLTNLLLTHIALALRVPLPGNYHTSMLSKQKALARERAAAPVAEDVDRAVALMPAPARPAASARRRNPRHRSVHERLGQRAPAPPAQEEPRWRPWQQDDLPNPWAEPQQQQSYYGEPYRQEYELYQPQEQPGYWQQFMPCNPYAPPLPLLAAPALPPLSTGPEPDACDWSEDSGFGGSSFSETPQQIQRLSAPYRRRYRQRKPYDRQ